jgi:iron transport multicopper oxidase
MLRFFSCFFFLSPSHVFASDLNWGKNENTFVLPPNAVIEVAWISGSGHAFLLQCVSLAACVVLSEKADKKLLNSGHSFDVIQSASGGGVNYVNPPRRDTVASDGTDRMVRFRFRTDNVG